MNAARFFMSGLLLLIFAVIKYLVIPDRPSDEAFSYLFGGGLILYGVYYAVIFLSGLVIGRPKYFVVSLLLLFVLLEIILLIFLQGFLILSLFERQDIWLFALFHGIAMLSTFAGRAYERSVKILEMNRLRREGVDLKAK